MPICEPPHECSIVVARIPHTLTPSQMKTKTDDFGIFTPTSNATIPISVESEIAIAGDNTGPADAPTMSNASRGTIRVLIVDDDRTLREGCASVLQVEGYNVSTCGRGDEALEMVRRAHYDIVMVDLYMTPVPGLEILKSVLAIRPGTIVLVMTGNPSVASSMEALRCGAWDYLPKPFSGTHLQVLLGRAAFAVLASRDQETARTESRESHGNSDKLTLLGTSVAFRRAVELARKVASTNASVMIVGESGTGKELIAQCDHRKRPIAGADREKVGLLEMANGGTFFLDELTEMPLPLQAKLLRVIQDGVVRRVGSEQQDAVVDGRFISATNRDPGEAIRSRHLREDLYFRLNVFPITLPPLRDRVEDIPILATFFLERFWARHHPSKDELPHFGDAAFDFLMSRPWRGNVRELQNVIEHVVVLAQPGSEIQPEEIPVHQD